MYMDRVYRQKKRSNNFISRCGLWIVINKYKRWNSLSFQVNSVARLADFSANLRILKIFLTSLRIFCEFCIFANFLWILNFCGFFVDFAFLRIFDNFGGIFLDMFVKLSPHARVAKRQTNSATSWKERKNFGKYLHTY